MAYVLPEVLGMFFLEAICLALSAAIITSYYCNKCYKNCCGVNSCLHSILKRTKIVKCVSETTTEFHGIPIEENSITIYHLICYIIWLLCGALIVFLDVLLIEVTNSCNSSALGTDCFGNIGGFSLKSLYDEPIDCNNFTSLSNKATFICYKYTLNLGGAFGIAGGLFATGIMFMNLIGACYGNQNRCCNIAGIFHMVVGILLSFAALVVVLAESTLREILIEDGTFIAIFQYIHILFSLMMAHYLFIGIMVRRLKQGNNNNYTTV